SGDDPCGAVGIIAHPTLGVDFGLDGQVWDGCWPVRWGAGSPPHPDGLFGLIRGTTLLTRMSFRRR
ncbi:MAG: hypothetical protein AAFY59_14600, partial [Pseudomonadota bacterium]